MESLLPDGSPKRGGAARVVAVVVGMLVVATPWVGFVDVVEASGSPAVVADRAKALHTNADSCVDCIPAVRDALMSTGWHPQRTDVSRLTDGHELVGVGAFDVDAVTVLQDDAATTPEGERFTRLQNKANAVQDTERALPGDLDGDGIDEVVVLETRGGKEFVTGIRVTHDAPPAVLFRHRVDYATDIDVGDVHGDGADEIVVLVNAPRPHIQPSGEVVTKFDVSYRLFTVKADLSGLVLAVARDMNADYGRDVELFTADKERRAFVAVAYDGAGFEPGGDPFGFVVVYQVDDGVTVRALLGDQNELKRERTAAWVDQDSGTSGTLEDVSGGQRLALAAGDVDGDGLDELFVLSEWSYFEFSLGEHVHEWDVYAFDDAAAVKPLTRMGPGVATTCRPFAAVTGDVDKDGRDELACLDFAKRPVLHDDSRNAFVATAGPAASNVVALVLADLDHDGADELVVKEIGAGMRVTAFGRTVVQTDDEPAVAWRPRVIQSGAASDSKAALVALDVDKDGIVVKYMNKHERRVTAPELLAVVAPPPVVDGVGQGPGRTQIDVGASLCNSKGSLGYLGYSFGLGAEVESSIFGVKIFGLELMLSVENEFAWEDTQEVCTSVTEGWYSDGTETAVLFRQAPVDVFHYEIVTHPVATEMGKPALVTLTGGPAVEFWPVSTYNAAARAYNAWAAQQNPPGAVVLTPQAPLVSADVITSTWGNPATYPTPATRDQLMQSARATFGRSDEVVDEEGKYRWFHDASLRTRVLTQPSKQAVLKSTQVDVTLVAGGGSLSVQRSQSSSSAFEWTLGAAFDVSVSALAAKAALSLHGGGGERYQVASESSSGVTAYVPSITNKTLFDAYTYKWGLFVYPVEIGLNNVSVVNYWVTDFKPSGPPRSVDAAPEQSMPVTGVAPTPVAFRWSPVPDARSYQLELRRLGADGFVVGELDVERVAAAPALPPPTSYATDDLTTGATYEWRVRGVDGLSKSGPWSPWAKFTVKDGPRSAPTVTNVSIQAGPTRPFGAALSPDFHRNQPAPLMAFTAADPMGDGTPPPKFVSFVADVTGGGRELIAAGAAPVPIVGGGEEPFAFRLGAAHLETVVHEIADSAVGPFTVAVWFRQVEAGEILLSGIKDAGINPHVDSAVGLDDAGHVMSRDMRHETTHSVTQAASVAPFATGEWQFLQAALLPVQDVTPGSHRSLHLLDAGHDDVQAYLEAHPHEGGRNPSAVWTFGEAVAHGAVVDVAHIFLWDRPGFISTHLEHAEPGRTLNVKLAWDPVAADPELGAVTYAVRAHQREGPGAPRTLVYELSHPTLEAVWVDGVFDVEVAAVAAGQEGPFSLMERVQWLPDITSAPAVRPVRPGGGSWQAGELPGALGGFPVQVSAAAHATKYRLQVAVDDAFVNVRTEERIDEKTFSGAGLPNGTYWVRARGENGVSTGPWSDAYRVQVPTPTATVEAAPPGPSSSVNATASPRSVNASSGAPEGGVEVGAPVPEDAPTNEPGPRRSTGEPVDRGAANANDDAAGQNTSATAEGAARDTPFPAVVAAAALAGAALVRRRPLR